MDIELKDLMILVVFPVIATIIGSLVFHFLIRPKKKPKLDIELTYLKGDSDRGKPVSGPVRQPNGRPVTDFDALYEFLITRRYRLVISNNSNDSAHKLKLLFRDGCRGILDIRDIGPMPLNAGQSLDLETKNFETVHRKYADDVPRDYIRDKSPVEGLEIMLEYENANGKKLCTLYTYSSTSPKTSRKKLKGFIY